MLFVHNNYAKKKHHILQPLFVFQQENAGVREQCAQRQREFDQCKFLMVFLREAEKVLGFFNFLNMKAVSIK